MKIRLRRVGLLVVAALILTGCHKLAAKTIIEPDGSGELQTEVGYSAEEKANIEGQNNNSQDLCNTSQTPSYVSVVEEQRGDETWCITTVGFKNLDGLRDLYGQNEGITIHRLEISEGRIYYDISLDTSAESFSALTEITWSVVLPGTPLSHNADETEENTLTWMPVAKSGIVNLRAESEVPQSGFSFPQCGATFAVIGMLFFQLKRHKRDGASL